MFGMWAPNWGFGLMVGGLLLKPIFPCVRLGAGFVSITQGRASKPQTGTRHTQNKTH